MNTSRYEKTVQDAICRMLSHTVFSLDGLERGDSK